MEIRQTMPPARRLPKRTDEARLLFVLDNDYGELTTAMFFLHGQALANRATVLLPPRLHTTNGGTLSVRNHL